MQGQTIASQRRLTRNHARIPRISQRVEQVLRYPAPETLHHLPSTHSLRRNNIAQLPRLLTLQQRNMCAPSRIVLDSLHGMRSLIPAIEVDHADPAFVTPASMPHRDVTGDIASADAVAFACESERSVGAAFPEVVVYRAAKMADARGAGLVGSEAMQGCSIGSADECLGRDRRGSGNGRWWGDAGGVVGMMVSLGGVVAEGKRRVEKWEGLRERVRSYSWLEHYHEFN